MTAFFLAIYTGVHFAGDSTTEFMDARRLQVLTAMRAVDDQLLQEIQDGVVANQKLLSTYNLFLRFDIR